MIKCEKQDKLTPAIIELETYIGHIFDWKHVKYIGIKEYGRKQTTRKDGSRRSGANADDVSFKADDLLSQSR